jgi:hypothetical protein
MLMRVRVTMLLFALAAAVGSLVVLACNNP